MCQESWCEAAAALWQAHLHLTAPVHIYNIGKSGTFVYRHGQTKQLWDAADAQYADIRILYNYTTFIFHHHM